MSGGPDPAVSTGIAAAAAVAADVEAFDETAGESLWLDAWKRLRKNHMAMGGLVVTVVMTLTAILADVITPFDPEVQERWTGALEPGVEHLDLRNEVTLEAGKTPRELDVPQSVANVLGDEEEHELRLTVQQETVSPIRLVADGGTIERLELRPPGRGVLRVEQLQLAEGEFLRVKDGNRLAAQLLEVGAAIPAGVPTEGGRYVRLLERVVRSAEDAYEVVARFDEQGKTVSVSRAGESVVGEPVAVRGDEVVDATLDGERIQHTHVLGTDQEGRDSLSRLIYGSRISLLVGVTATLVSLIIGVIFGAVSGYAGGKTDAFMMRLVDVLFALPYIFLVILLLVAFGRSIIMLFVALGAVQWLTMARIVRGQVLSLREKEFVDAAVTVGTRTWGILWRHLIPNTMGVVVVYTTLTVPIVILQESLLAFLGLTVEWDGRPLESWGAMVDYGRNALGSNGENWWLLIWPAAAMSITLFSLNFLGDGLRDALDPQQRGRN